MNQNRAACACASACASAGRAAAGGAREGVAAAGAPCGSNPPVVSGASAGTFDAAVARHKGRIYSYLYRMTGSREDAEDLTQEVFVRAFVHRRAFGAGEEPSLTWLFRVARRLAVDAFRRSRRRGAAVDSLDAPVGGEAG